MSNTSIYVAADAIVGIFLLVFGVVRNRWFPPEGFYISFEDYSIWYPSKASSLIRQIIMILLIPVTILLSPALFILMCIPGIRILVGYILNFLGGIGLMQNLLLSGKGLGLPARRVESEWDGIGEWLG